MLKHRPDNPILIIGGHATPAEAVAEELLSRRVPVVWVGPAYINRNRSKGHEQEICQRLSIPYVSVALPKWDRTKPLSLIVAVLKMPGSLLQSYRLLRLIQPRSVLGFGGYMLVPFAIASRFLGLRVIIHEQTTVVGRANRIARMVATKSLISWPQTRGAHNSIVVGNPVRKAIATSKASNRKNQLFVTGGNQGAQVINKAVFGALPMLLSHFETIVHQTGEFDFDKALNQQSNLPSSMRRRYQPVAYLDAKHFSNALTSSKLVLARSGANTITELLVTKTPAVLVPLPHAALGEQYLNAQLLVDLGLAILLDQSQLAQLETHLTGIVIAPNHKQIAKLTPKSLGAAAAIADLVS